MDSPPEPTAGAGIDPPKGDPPEIDPLCAEILRYLAENPNVRDTLEGVAEWWLLECEIRREIAKVQGCLDWLVAEGWVLAVEGPDGRIHYKVDPARQGDLPAVAGGSGGSRG